MAMKLHTKDQAPKEGGKEAAKQPFQQVSQLTCGDQLHSFAGASWTCMMSGCSQAWEMAGRSRFKHCLLSPSIPLMQWKPTKEGFLRFLVESKVVYDTIERVIQEAPRPECEIPVLRAAMLWGDLKWTVSPATCTSLNVGTMLFRLSAYRAAMCSHPPEAAGVPHVSLGSLHSPLIHHLQLRPRRPAPL